MNYSPLNYPELISSSRWGEIFPSSGEIPAIFHGTSSEEKLNYLRVRNEAKFTELSIWNKYLEWNINLIWTKTTEFHLWALHLGGKEAKSFPYSSLGRIEEWDVPAHQGSELEGKLCLKEGLRGISFCRDPSSTTKLGWTGSTSDPSPAQQLL